MRKIVICKDLFDGVIGLEGDGSHIGSVLNDSLEALPELLRILPLSTLDFDLILSSENEVRLLI